MRDSEMTQLLKNACARLITIVLWAGLAAKPSGAAEAWHAMVEEQLAAHPSLMGKEFAVDFPSTVRPTPECAGQLSAQTPRARNLAGPQVFLIRCSQPKPWSFRVKVTVKVFERYVAAQTNLAPGQIIEPGDWIWVKGDVSGLPRGGAQLVVTPPDSMEVVRPIAAGSPISLNDVRKSVVIRRGDQVTVTVQGDGFQIQTLGNALADASAGDTVNVKTPEGKTVQGIAMGRGDVRLKIK